MPTMGGDTGRTSHEGGIDDRAEASPAADPLAVIVECGGATMKDDTRFTIESGAVFTPAQEARICEIVDAAVANDRRRLLAYLPRMLVDRARRVRARITEGAFQ